MREKPQKEWNMDAARVSATAIMYHQDVDAKEAVEKKDAIVKAGRNKQYSYFPIICSIPVI